MKIANILFVIILIVFLVYYFLFLRKLYSSPKVVFGNINIPADKLMVVAHPDDETIFGGIQLLQDKGWKIVCVTNGSVQSNNIFRRSKNNNRIIEFSNVMNSLQYPYEVWDFEDNFFNNHWDEGLLIQKLVKLFNEKTYHKIVTHNLSGEYGHKQHRKLSEIIHYINPPNLYVFNVDQNIFNQNHPKWHDLLLLLDKYGSQNQIIQKHYFYILHQTIKPICY